MSAPGPPLPPPEPYAPPTVAVREPLAPSPRRPSGRGSFAVLLVAFAVLVGAMAYLVTRPDDPPSPGEAVRDWAMALYAEDVGAICGGLAASTVERIERRGTSCEAAFEGTFDLVDETGGSSSSGDADRDPDEPVDLLRPIHLVGSREPSIEILDVEIEGDRAAVRVQVDDSETGATRPIILVREQGRWKIDVDASLATDGPSRTCETEERVVKTAVEAYRAQTGEDPADARALVDARMLQALPEHARVAADGSVRMTGECA
jgi:hypothetical protein